MELLVSAFHLERAAGRESSRRRQSFRREAKKSRDRFVQQGGGQKGVQQRDGKYQSDADGLGLGFRV